MGARISDKGGGEPRSILIVEDDEVLRAALTRIVTVLGYWTQGVGDGEEALAAMKTVQFDVILSDIQMPKMNGVDLLRAIRSRDLDIPVILMTGTPSVETAIEAVSLGALQYLVKPTPPNVLKKVLSRACWLHGLAKVKRDALELLGRSSAEAGDLAGLRAGFERALDSMWIAFQPIVDVKRKRVFGYEALMRSREESLPTPGAILGAAERLESLPILGQRIRKLAAKDFENAPEHAHLFVNLHAQDLLDPTLFVAGAPLMKFRERVVLEITERSALDNISNVQGRVEALRVNQFRIAVDDLGAGYAGLSSLAALEPEIVKIDLSLVRGVETSTVRQRVVRSITQLCAEMDILVVAEGVEKVEERAMLEQLGCELLQGYLFARPTAGFAEVAL